MSAMPAPVFAGFWRRFAAWVIDFIIIYFAALAGVILLATLAPGAPEAIYPLAGIVGAGLYFAGFHSSARQATPGKRSLKIKVTDAFGHRIDFRRAVIRYFASLFSAIALLLGFVMSAFTARKRALHDIIANTLVVNEAASADEIVAGGSVMPLTAGVWAVIVIPIAGAILLAALSIDAFHKYQARALSGGAGARASPSPR